MIERDSAIQDILEKRGGTLLLIGEFLLTSNEVLDRLSISRKTLYNWEHKNYLLPIDVGGKKRYKLSDINAILNNARQTTLDR